jgi:hypothetical protein
MNRRTRHIALAVALLTALFALNYAPVAYGSIFGEENVTLVQMLVQLTQSKQTLDELNSTAGETASMTRDLLTTYQNVNSGIEQLQNYSFDEFLLDIKTDLYHQYPGFGQLEYASNQLGRWDQTHTRSPFTAYQAITAVFGDVTKPLRNDIAAGHANVDPELVLKGEAAGGMAAAHSAEQDTERFDREQQRLEQTLSAAQNSPGASQQATARATLLMVQQQSYLMRLLARTVRLDSVNASLEYGARMKTKNATYQRRSETFELTREALKPPPLMHFDEEK